MSHPTPVTADLFRSMPLPAVTADSDKDARGRVLCVGGSAEVPGAAALAGEAALRAGAGKLQLAAPRSVAKGLALAVPEARVFALAETRAGEIGAAGARSLAGALGRCDAVLVGPGMIDPEAAAKVTAILLDQSAGPAFVLDAGAIGGLWATPERVRRHGGRVVLTPHAGEMAALCGATREAVEADPLGCARAAAARLQAVVALKGRDTFIASPDGKAWLYVDGPVGLATSGSGDVLAGIIIGLLARGASAVQSAAWGVYLHGEAGLRLSRRVGRLGLLARELGREVPAILEEVEG